MDRPTRGGWNRRGGRGFGRPGPSGAVAAWTSSTGTTRSCPELDLDFAGGERGTRGGRGFAGRRGVGGQMQGGRGGLSRLVWRPKSSHTSPAPASSAEGDAASCSATLDNDDLLGQILLRLPPLPSSLPRAAAVCRRWRRLVADPGFLGRFSAHHGRAPLLGFFFYDRGRIGFTPVLDPPDPIPAADRLTLRLPRGSRVHGCRHGRVLIAYGNTNSFMVWDPVAGDQYHLPFPSASGGIKYAMDATIICAASANDQGHVHGACHSSPFKVVFLGRRGEQIITYVYSSETDAWGDAISMMCLNPFDPDDFLSCNTLVGNSIYWLLDERTTSILEFDSDRQSLATIELPPDLIDINPFVREEREFLVMPAEGCGLGLLIIAGFSARIWKRKSSCDGNAGWVLINTIMLDSHLRLKPWAYTSPPVILGFADDHNVAFLLTGGGVIYMVHLESWQFKKLPHKKRYRLCYPFTSFCAAELGPLYPVSSVPQLMTAKDLWSPHEAINGREPNSGVEVGVADWWDPMVLEASISATSVQNQRS